MKEGNLVKKGISGSTLKIIAITAMLIDHIGAVILEPYLRLPGHWTQDLYDLHYFMRMIVGRIAFPIFCFLLTEGFQKTSNIWKYMIRLGIFALVSEIPFDLAFHGVPFYWSSQNVFFTLFIGLLGMMALHWLEESGMSKIFQVLLGISAAVAAMVIAEFLQTDYSSYGVFCILVLYLFRKWRILQVPAGCAAYWIGDSYLFRMNGAEKWAPAGLVPVLLYDGRRGLKMKYVFYLFYPVHLLILHLISVFVLANAV